MQPTHHLHTDVRAFAQIAQIAQIALERPEHELCRAAGVAFGITEGLTNERIFPITIKSETNANFARSMAQESIGSQSAHHQLEPRMGTEHLSCIVQNEPGAHLQLGQGMGARGSALHNSRYDFNDDILTLGAALHASLIERAMPLPAA